KTMLLTKLNSIAILLLLATGVLGTVAAVAVCQNPAADPAERPATIADAEPKNKDTPKTAPEERFDNAPGWSWFYDSPRPRSSFGTAVGMAEASGRGLSAVFETDKDGALLVCLAYRRTDAALDYRPVVFDAERKRYPLRLDRGGGHHDVRLASFRLDPQ